MKYVGQQSHRHIILLDCPVSEPVIGYLRNRTDENLERLASMQNSKIAYFVNLARGPWGLPLFFEEDF